MIRKLKSKKKQRITHKGDDFQLKPVRKPVKEKYKHLSKWLENEADLDNNAPFNFFQWGEV